MRSASSALAAARVKHYLSEVRFLRVALLVGLLLLVLGAAWHTGALSTNSQRAAPVGACGGGRIVAKGVWSDSLVSLPSLMIVPGDTLRHGPQGDEAEWWEVPELPAVLVCGLNKGAFLDPKALPAIHLRFRRGL